MDNGMDETGYRIERSGRLQNVMDLVKWGSPCLLSEDFCVSRVVFGSKDLNTTTLVLQTSIIQLAHYCENSHYPLMTESISEMSFSGYSMLLPSIKMLLFLVSRRVCQADCTSCANRPPVSLRKSSAKWGYSILLLCRYVPNLATVLLTRLHSHDFHFGVRQEIGHRLVFTFKTHLAFM